MCIYLFYFFILFYSEVAKEADFCVASWKRRLYMYIFLFYFYFEAVAKETDFCVASWRRRLYMYICICKCVCVCVCVCVYYGLFDASSLSKTMCVCVCVCVCMCVYYGLFDASSLSKTTKWIHGLAYSPYIFISYLCSRVSFLSRSPSVFTSVFTTSVFTTSALAYPSCRDHRHYLRTNIVFLYII